MLDLKWIRENAESFDKSYEIRELEAKSALILELDQQNREAQTALQSLQAERNEKSKKIGQVKRDGGDADALMQEVADIKAKMADLESVSEQALSKLTTLLQELPNIPDAEVPAGADEADNVEVLKWGTPKQIENAKEHFELGEALGLMDFERASKISGSRFVVLKGQLSRLERALSSFMLDIHTREFGYTEVSPPVLVRDNAMFGTGQLPKFHEDSYRTTEGHWLVPTAEVSLTNLVADEILAEEVLPLRFVAYTPCFRSEAGSAGRDTRGMLRQHQFGKVELVSITHPDASVDEHERMTQCAETVLQRLELPYRKVILCGGDLGFGARKTYDLEVWLPGQNSYREISSCSNTGAFQARRMKARFRPKEGKNVQFVHTLNGSGVAVGRCLIAVLENGQQADGSIVIPHALRPYMDGQDVIKIS